MVSEHVLKIENLTVGLRGAEMSAPIVDNLSLAIRQHSITAIVGGSGSGKSTTGLSILRLLADALVIKAGKIIFEGQDVLSQTEEDVRRIRGKAISMIFQEPLYAFNPVFRIGEQIEEVLIYHTDLSKPQRQAEVLALLDTVGIKEPQRVAKNYPHQLSGGMRQRAMIAQAIAAKPQMIIADEPTSNLDVTLQARIIELFKRLRAELDTTILLITHDLGMVQHMADDVAVMTQGRIVEFGATTDVLANP